MTQYEDLLKEVLNNGTVKSDRTGVGTLSTFGHMLKFDLSKGFPLITTKKIHFKSVVFELLWFLQGATNTQFLKENGVTIWDEWADPNGDLGPIYGFQWRSWPTPDGTTIDQISKAIWQIRNTPDSRRIIVNAWNVADIEKMSLPPCHVLFQFYVSKGKLSCLMFQRSCDLFLGVPFNIASFALLTHMFAHVCNLEVGDFVHFFGDTHIYLNHVEQVKTQLQRTPNSYPNLIINRKVENIFDFKYEDFSLDGYNPHPAIKAPIAI